MELLFDALSAALSRREDLLTEVHVAVPNRAMERSLEVHVAATAGIACNLRFVRIDALGQTLFGEPSSPDARWTSLPAQPAQWEALLYAVLEDITAGRALDPELDPVRRWLSPAELGGDARAIERRALSLAAHLSELFGGYDRTRPELVRAWAEEGPVPAALGLSEGALLHHERWQRALVRAARAKVPVRFTTEMLDELSRAPVQRDGKPLHVIGMSHTTRTGMAILGALDRQRPVTLYALDPSREFWEDVESGAERGRRIARERTAQAPVEGGDSALLAAWGRAGREHLAELNERSGWDADERFDEPTPPSRTALGEIQSSILERRPVTPGSPDGTVTLLACPSVRRELEVVATEIWRRIDQGARFADVAVLLHEGERERYLPLLPSVLAEAHDMPWSAVDVPLAWRSRIVAGAARLLDLMASEPTRGRILDLLAHPSVRALFAEARPAAWSSMLDRLGFFAGLGDEGPSDGDMRQALDRMALGAVSAGERSGDERPVGRWLPEEIDAGADESGGLYRLLRSLWADLSFARRARLSLTAWADFFDAAFAAYLVPDGPRDEADAMRVRRSLGALRARQLPEHDVSGVPEHDVSGVPEHDVQVSVEVACTLLSRELAGMRAEIGAPTLAGITVSTLVPMRAIPFRHVFVLGLGEGRFGAAREGRGFDLRRGARLRGDVEDAERDRYTFLETLLSARESLTVSWVARDEATGDPLEAAAVVRELRDAAHGRAGTLTPALRRHEDVARGPIAAGALLGVDAERRARSLGDLERDELDGGAGHGAGLAISAFRAIARGDDPRRALLTWDAVGPTAPAMPLTPPAPAAPSGSRLASRLARPSASAAVPLATGPERRIGLNALAELLHRPMQAAAEHALGAAGAPPEPRLDEPPIAVSRRIASGLLREVVRRALADPARAPRDHLRERALRERARGHFPGGALGERAEADLLVTVTALLGVIRTVLGAAADETVAGARFGPGRATGPDHALALPALDLGPGLRDRRIVVVGETRSWLADHGRAMVILDPLGHLGVGRQVRAREGRALLRAFLDHAALACSHHATSTLGRTVHLVTPSGALSALLLPYGESAARTWLRGLCDELGAGHAAFLPGEVVLGESDRIRRGDPTILDTLSRSLERARAKDDRLGELKGPVRDARERPGPHDLLRVVGRRFGPFFEHLQLPGRSASEERP